MVESETELPMEAPKREMQGLFEAFPHGTLAAIATGAGFIAVCTLAIEIVTRQWLANAVALNISFLSLPLGVATMVLAGLTARGRVLYAVPAVLFGTLYWAVYGLMVW
ncbi:MAG: hypothetical protein ACNA8W_00115 [Bradymonadaceae bacterium]